MKRKRNKTKKDKVIQNKLQRKYIRFARECNKLFKDINVGIRAGVFIISHLSKRFDDHEKGLLAYWGGANGDTFKYWETRKRIKYNHYIAYTMGYTPILNKNKFLKRKKRRIVRI